MKNRTYDIYEVFTPTSPAVASFVERDAKISSHLNDALKTPGKQIVIYGYSKCGENYFVENKVSQKYPKVITTRCIEGVTYEEIILEVFDQIGDIFSEKQRTRSFKLAPELQLSYDDIKASFKLGNYSNQTTIADKQILPPQLTPHRLATFLGKANCCWVLEDYHRVNSKDKNKLVGLMKVFKDMADDYPSLKIIALGAVGTARQVVEYNSEMEDRVTEIYVPYMSDEEIAKIIDTGEHLLNLKFKSNVKKKIIKYSCGLPAVCHQLCLNICSEKGLDSTAISMTTIDENDLDQAIEKYIAEKSDTLKKQFDKAVKIPNNTPKNIPKLILTRAIEIGTDEFSFDEIYSGSQIKRINRDRVESFLNDLCSENRCEILNYDEDSNYYRFSNLFLKSYCILNLKKKSAESRINHRDSRIVDLLLNIIEKDIITDYDLGTDAYIEDF